MKAKACALSFLKSNKRRAICFIAGALLLAYARVEARQSPDLKTGFTKENDTAASVIMQRELAKDGGILRLCLQLNFTGLV